MTTAVIVIVVLIIAIGAGVYYYHPATQQVTTTSTGPAAIPYNQTLIVDNSLGELSGLDPQWGGDFSSAEITQNIYEPLIWYSGNSTLKQVGVLATDWTSSPDGMTYTFHLRQGVHFSNGRPFTAYSVWFNYYRLSVNNPPNAFMIGRDFLPPGAVTKEDLNTFDFINPTPDQLAKMQNPNQSIQVVDPYTITFHLSQPVASFLARLSTIAGSIEDPTFVQEHGGVQGNSTENTYLSANGAPGTAPYMVSSWTRGCCITLTLNPYYWGPTPHASKVIIQYKSNVVDDINDLTSGNAQMLFTIPFQSLPQVGNATSQGIVLVNHGLSYYIVWISLNTARYPLNITLVRQAINYAVNKDLIIQKLLGGYAVTFQGPMPQGMFGYDNNNQPYPYDPGKAKQLLAQAGFPNGVGLRTLTLMYPSDPFVASAMQAVQSDLAAVGINVNLEVVTHAVFYNVQNVVPRLPNYPDMIEGNWFPDWAYPDDYTWPMDNIANPTDMSNINDTRLNNLTETSMYESSEATRAQMYSQIQALDHELAPNIWLFQEKVQHGVPAYRKEVQNVTSNPLMYGFRYQWIYILPTGGSAAISAPLCMFWIAENAKRRYGF
jgi:peptide/nickel transport system substrate-binding protein